MSAAHDPQNTPIPESARALLQDYAQRILAAEVELGVVRTQRDEAIALLAEWGEFANGGTLHGITAEKTRAFLARVQQDEVKP